VQVAQQHGHLCAMVLWQYAARCIGVVRSSTHGRAKHYLRKWSLRAHTARPASTLVDSSTGAGQEPLFPDSQTPGTAADALQGAVTVELAEDGCIPPEVAELFQTLRGEALRRLEEFGPIHLFSLCWAYSTARLLDADLEQRITDAALRLGRARDAEPRAARSSAAADGGAAGSTHGVRVAEAAGPAGEPMVVAQAEHWMALYKPPFWQVDVDSKEAAKAAAVTPFEDDDDGDAEEDGAPEEHRKRQRMHAWIRQNFAPQYPICSDAIEAFGLLHRLDAQTSGLLLCAKTYVGAYWLRLQWCSYLVDKEYVCLVHGWVDRGTREIHKRIRVDKRKAPNSRRTVSTHCTVGANGKPSYTEVFTLAHLTGVPAGSESGAPAEKFSLVALKLHTGRTHQIRVHMLSIGHPLVCDVKYAEDRFASDRTWCPRNFLHTYRLSFADIPDGAGEATLDVSSVHSVVLHCPLPNDLHHTLSLLQPADATSARYCAEWLSRDSSRMCSFEEYIEAAT